METRHKIPSSYTQRMIEALDWIQRNKDFFLVLAALISPFAAVLVGFRASKRQAAALIDSTRMQVRSAALRDARQRAWEKLRDEFAAQIFGIIELNDALNEDARDWDALWLQFAAIEARGIRIHLCVSAEGLEDFLKWAEQETAVYTALREKINSLKKGTITKEQNDVLLAAIHELPGLARNVLANEEKRFISIA